MNGKSQYDNIKTATDLIDEVRQRMLSTDQDDLNRAADIFGRSAVEELAALANDQKLQKTFYFIAFNIWNWEDAVRFYNEYTNPVTKDAKETARRLDAVTAKHNEISEQLGEMKEKYWDECHKRREAEGYLNHAKNEILKLKAKLYDLTVESPEGCAI